LKLRFGLVAFFVAATACAPSLPRPYLVARAAALRAYSAGRFGEAAEDWQKASRATSRTTDANEARYRSAYCLMRAGSFDEARMAYQSIVRDTPRSSEAPRAAYDLSVIEVEHGDRARGFQMMEDVVRHYPSSGIAKSALHRTLIFQEEQGGPNRALSYLNGLIAALDRTGIAEHLHFDVAVELDKQSRWAAARDRYLYVAKRFPYPFGDLWDDSLYAASIDDEKLGDYRAAIAVLERMLKQDEPSFLTGSYELPRYPQAQFRIAVLYRDRLHDDRAARRAFHKVWTDHPTTLLRDDALWNEALLAKKDGDTPAACSALELMAHGMPYSRYVPCADRLCPSAPPAKKGQSCHAYIQREITHALGATAQNTPTQP
jgi:tetratricopeptide (TPR) repeat protein